MTWPTGADSGSDVHVHIIGSGLIGASIGLALVAAGVDVTLEDVDDVTAAAAQDRGAGRVADGLHAADVVIVAIPPRLVAMVIASKQRLNLNATFMDVSSVKDGVVAEAEALGVDLSRFVPSHPIAGRERGGPLNARGDLFRGRSWVITATELAKPAHVAAAESLIAACGARPVHLTPAEHDAALALVSHLPQLLASALASELVDAPFDVAVLSGQGLRDSTRIADSDPHLWRDIVTANAAHIAPLVDRVRSQLDSLAAALHSGDPGAAVEQLVADGRRGRARIGSTHGGPASPVDVVSVFLRDTPGELSRIFLALQHAEVNVDDLRIDHAPGQPVGVLELTVAHGAGQAAVVALSEWRARVAPSVSR